ncbi:MAG: alanine--tRNA ligase [Candidatus Marinimicrobia bacterium]|nr:alanine--tRNA ligase [Candidatus Neomarinimicrobiota bacterium]
MDSKTIRQQFITFFKEKQHRFVRSSAVVPVDDPTLLFTNAGMNQFKPIFLGQETRPYVRAVNSQKCIRVSGKHNDLEEVGVDTFHHTFFEMLGNWSFGDYYKREAICWAWELFTEVWGLDKNRLWATVYETDNDAYNLWKQETDIAPERILRYGTKDNFWEMGETGPCGPCSEIHYYVGDDPEKQSAAGVNVSDEYWELWNLVFIQNERLPDGNLIELPAKHVDTGLGLERVLAVIQGKSSNYETDLFSPIITKTAGLSRVDYAVNPVPFRVIADHIRMLTFSIADGAMPSNDGRGYVLRRILRRAARFGRMLELHEPFLYQLVDTVVQIMGEAFPELVEKHNHISNVIRAEEISFNETLDRGLNNFEKVVTRLSGSTISGSEAFRLYDTYGFPLDLTQLMARERGLEVDEAGFEREMVAQKSRAKAAGKFQHDTRKIDWQTFAEGSDSKFLGYETASATAQVRRWARLESDILLVLDQTPFYAESGGQVGDTGKITGRELDLQVVDTWKDGDRFVHQCRGTFNVENAGETVHCEVGAAQRWDIKRNHTATHLMHAALKQVLGDHVHQAGSLVTPEQLRFDLTHFEKLTREQRIEVESLVNREIRRNSELNVDIKSFDEARQAGAEALFGEKYGDEVRMITIADFSKELCGGTHVERTGDIGFFKIIEESALAAGVRRIVALTGKGAEEYIQDMEANTRLIQARFNCQLAELPERIDQLLAQKKQLEKELKRKQQVDNKFNVRNLMEKGSVIGNYNLVVATVAAVDNEDLKTKGDSLLEVLNSGVGVLGADMSGKPGAVVVVTPDLVQAGIKAGDLAREIGKFMGAGGGGRPHLATAGGKDLSKLPAALENVEKKIVRQLENLK